MKTGVSIVALLVLVGLSAGCPAADPDPLVSWQMEGDIYGIHGTWQTDFYEDGTFKYTSIAGIPVSGTWEDLGGGNYEMLVTSVQLVELKYVFTVASGQTIETGSTLTGQYIADGVAVADITGSRL